MRVLYKIYSRIYQNILKFVSNFALWREPKVFEGKDCLKKLPHLLKEEKIERVCIVTDESILSLGLLKNLIYELNSKGIYYCIYSKTVVNPTVENVEEAKELYIKNSCQGIIAFGGGSPMDCAKAMGALVVSKGKTIEEMRGLFKVRKKIPPFFAVPTTAGTGSEATVAAVITNSETHEKYAINDVVLIPHYAFLDATLTLGLPSGLTATTGMDALTHAIEAYVGRSNTKTTEEYSLEAIKLIFSNIIEAYTNGENIGARIKMQKASYLAGVSFTRAYVGYVHAISHSLGGTYGVPHGLANAIILPYVLEYYGYSVHKSLAKVADALNISDIKDSDEIKAKLVIEKIKKLNKDMKIPKEIKEIRMQDLDLLTKKCLKEANPLYPVPRILFKEDIVRLLLKIKGN